MTQATPDIRRALLRSLDAPTGTVTIVRHPVSGGDEIVVYIAPGVRLPRDKMPLSFHGVPVRYQTRVMAKAYR